MNLKIFAIILAVLATSTTVSLEDIQPFATCFISLQGNPEKYPLFLTRTNTFYGVVIMNDIPVIRVRSGGVVKLACTGAGNYIDRLGAGKVVSEVRCSSNGKFRADDGFYYDIKELMCQRIPDSMTRTMTNENVCGQGQQSFEAGFSLSPQPGFIRLYTMCRNNKIQRTTFSRFNLPADAGRVVTKRFDFRGSDGRLYRGNLNQLQNLPDLHEKYRFDNKSYYLARGHLVANANFNYASQNRATFFYMNAAPQWQIFNAGNWYKVEDRVKKIAKSGNIFVGAFGHLSLEQKSGSRLPLFLDMENKALPVPEFFWMFVQLQNSRTFFVAGVNDPFVTESEYVSKANTFCEVTACTEISWTESPQIFCCNPTRNLLNKMGINL